MASQPLDFSDLGGKPIQPQAGGSFDFSDLGGKPITAAPQASFMDRLNKRVAADFEPLHRPQKFITDTIQEGARRLQQPYVPGSGLKEIYQQLKQTYSDPANVAGDVVSGYMLGQGGGGEEAQPGGETPAPKTAGAPSPKGGLLSKMTSPLASDLTGLISPRLAHLQRVAGRLLGRMNEAPEAAPAPTPQPSYTGPTGPPQQWGTRLAPEPPAPKPSLSEQMESAQPERRVSQRPYEGANRRVAPEERGFLTAPPLDPERIGVDYRPAEDLGVKVRQETEAAKGPIKRGAKALKQAEALGKSPTSNKLIQKMGGQPVETVTGEREPYVPLGFREGPPAGTIVPQSSEEMQSALDMSLRRARRGRILPND